MEFPLKFVIVESAVVPQSGIELQDMRRHILTAMNNGIQFSVLTATGLDEPTAIEDLVVYQSAARAFQDAAARPSDVIHKFLHRAGYRDMYERVMIVESSYARLDQFRAMGVRLAWADNAANTNLIMSDIALESGGRARPKKPAYGRLTV